MILYTKKHCAFVEWGNLQGAAELRGSYSELRKAKIRRAATRLPFNQLFRRT